MQNRSYTLLAATTLLAALAACGSDSKSTSQPNSDVLKPTGTIQGTLTDAVTNAPIQNAVVSIGLASATTDALGQYTIKDVPATADSLNHTLSGTYIVSIDLQKAKNALDANAVYPKVAYSTADVSYTSLDDTNGTTPGAGSGTNHDTPVTGIVKGFQLKVGKLAATISGVLGAGLLGDCKDFVAAGASYTVQLVSKGSNNSSTGNADAVVASATTDASGAFSFTGVESLKAFQIRAFNADRTMVSFVKNPDTTKGGYIPGSLDVTAPADGQTEVLSLESNSAPAPIVCSADLRGPAIVKVTPAPGSDVTPAAATQVVFSFSEPVDGANPLFSTVPGVPGNLYEKIEVNYAGQKSGNVAYTLAWNSTFDALTVTLPTAPSGKYYVRLTNMAGLKDAAGNDASLGLCPDDAVVPSSYGLKADNDPDDCTAYFTTSGGPTAAAPTGLAILNLNLIDYAGVKPQLDWLPASGAKKYNVYRTVYQWPGYPVPVTGALAATAEAGTTKLVKAGVTDTEYPESEDLPFVESNNIPLAYVYTVTAVNSDGVENPVGVSVNASDKVAPQLSSLDFDRKVSGGTVVQEEEITLKFNELMNEPAAETFANYTVSSFPGFAASTITGAQYTAAGLVLTFDNIEWAVSSTNTCSTSVTGTDDVQAIPVNSATCVLYGATGTHATPVGDDQLCGTGTSAGVCAGADGVCNTVAASGDSQVTASGSVPKCVTEGPNKRLDVTLGGTDYRVHGLSGLKLGAGVTDVAGNPIDTRFDEIVFTYLNGSPVQAGPR